MMQQLVSREKWWVGPLAGMALWLGVMVGLFPGAVYGVEVKVIKVNYQNPANLCDTLRRLHGGEARFAEAPNINAIIVSSDNPAIVQAVETLVRELDRRPATLRYEIRSDSTGNDGGTSVVISRNGNIRPQQTRTWNSGNQTRMVVGLEGQEVGLIDQTMRVETFPSGYGYPDRPVVITEDRGLKVRGRLNGKGEVTVEVLHAEGGPNQARQVVTQMLVPVGQWFEVGGVGDTRSGGGNTVGISGGRLEGQINRGSRNDTQKFMLRIVPVP